MHTKAVLFIDNHQGQAIELHLLLEDGVRPDHHRHLAAGNSFLLGEACLAFLLAGQPTHLNPQGFKPLAEVIGMLFGEQFGGSHQRHLFTVSNDA
ncbi:hypothetical protein D3C71_2034550 [compost metagenome]